MRIETILPATAPNSDPFISTDKWTNIVIVKESSGQIVIGTDADLFPIGSGKGISLPADQPLKMLLAPNTKLYAGAATSERFSLIATPIPVGDIVTRIVEEFIEGFKQFFGR